MKVLAGLSVVFWFRYAGGYGEKGVLTSIHEEYPSVSQGFLFKYLDGSGAKLFSVGIHMLKNGAGLVRPSAFPTHIYSRVGKRHTLLQVRFIRKGSEFSLFEIFTLTDGTWYHLGATYNTNRLDFYRDGVMVTA